jgi:hypothetical protein
MGNEWDVPDFQEGFSMHKQKAFLQVFALSLIAGIAFLGCPRNSKVTSSKSNPDSDKYTGITFDINNLPDPAFWNEKGHQHQLPNPFRFADGHLAKSAKDWPARRAEISKIVQYYEYGMMPPDPDSITYETISGENTKNPLIRITMKVGANTAVFNVGARIPSGDGPFPAIINCSGSDNGAFYDTLLNDASWARISYNVGAIASEGNHRGVVETLFGYGDYTKNLDAPSVLMAYAWGVGRIMDAIEAGAFGGKIDAKKLAITGFSRWGKAALVIGAFAKSRNGTQIAITAPGSAGSGGPTLERFLSATGAQDDNITSITGLPGKILYLKKIPDTNPRAQQYAVKAVLGMEPFNEASDSTHNGWTNKGDWGGIQTLAQARNEVPSWFSARFKQFADLHYGLNLDYADDQPNRTPHGFLCTIPFDQHFLASLVAPRALFIYDGFKTFRNNVESQFMNYLAVSEVYNLLNADNSVGIKLYNIPHQMFDYEAQDIMDFGNAYFAHVAPPAKFKDPPFPINDPRSKKDYQRLDWAAPGRTPVAAQVK